VLFAGIGPSLLGIIPFSGISFASYETGKKVLTEWGGYGTVDALPLPLRLAAGAGAGVTAQTLTYPFHIVKRRLQVEPGVYSSVWNGFARISQSEGVARGLFKGLTLSWVKMSLSACVSFASNDLLQALVRRLRLQQAAAAPFAKNKLHPLENMFAGGLAGALAKTAVAPADRVKILYQVNPERHFSLSKAWHTGATIYKNSGVLGLFRGNGAQLFRVVPYAALSYASFPVYQKQLGCLQGHKGDNFSTRFIAGAMAGATATVFTYPLDLLRARMAAHWNTNPRYTGLVSAVHTIVKEEGAWALLGGLRPSLLGILPYAGCSFAVFESIKSYLRKLHAEPGQREKDVKLPTHQVLPAGAFAGLVAQSATYPLDVVRRRMQVNNNLYASTWQAFMSIYSTEGLVKGLYKGLSMNWIKGPIAVGVSYTVNEKASFYNIYFLF
jgi:solute carrier family 25 protein 42